MTDMHGATESSKKWRRDVPPLAFATSLFLWSTYIKSGAAHRMTVTRGSGRGGIRDSNRRFAVNIRATQRMLELWVKSESLLIGSYNAELISRAALVFNPAACPQTAPGPCSGQRLIDRLPGEI